MKNMHWKYIVYMLWLCLYAPFVFSIEEIPVPDFKDISNEILKIKLPKNITQSYPYYLSGYEEDGVPIWVAEMGKWDHRKVAEGSPESFRDYKLNLLQLFKRLLTSQIGNNEDDIPEFILILDMDGFSSHQASSLAVLRAFIWISRQAEKALSEHVKAVYIINANFIFTHVFTILKPVLGRAVYKVEIFGTNKQQWIPKLLKVLPKDQIPEWYGGSPTHKPVAFYG